MYFKKTRIGYVVRLKRGEEIIETLTSFARKRQIKAAFVIGLGAVREVEMGYFDTDKKEYLHKNFPQEFEISTLVGNFTVVEKSPFLHAHLTISNPQCEAFAGHLFRATISGTGEFLILDLGVKIERKLDKETGLKLLDL